MQQWQYMSNAARPTDLGRRAVDNLVMEREFGFLFVAITPGY